MARSRALARLPLLDRAHTPAGALVNVALRVAILALSVDALLNGQDQRFSGKDLGPRDVIISFGFAMVFPLFWRLRYRKRQWSEYPWWFDDLYLSIFFVDMLGNSLNLYNALEHWDHVPHFHGPGALAIVLAGAFGWPIVSAMGISTMLHLALEIQEFYGDVFLHTHNVRDTQDSINDLLFGLLGVLVYGAIWARSRWLARRRARPMRQPRR